jgi:hypothetical protein
VRVSSARLGSLIAPHYPKGGKGLGQGYASASLIGFFMPNMPRVREAMERRS